MKYFILLFALGISLYADCSTALQQAYQVGNSNRGGAMNPQHAMNICEAQLGAYGLGNTKGAFEACMMGLDPNPYNKDLPSLILRFCQAK